MQRGEVSTLAALPEQGARALRRVGDIREGRGRPQFVRSLRSRDAGRQARRRQQSRRRNV